MTFSSTFQKSNTTAEQDIINEQIKFLEKVIDCTNLWLDVLDKDGNILIWNRAAEEISGYSREEVVGHGKVWHWLYPDKKYRKKIRKKVKDTIKKGLIVEDFETTITRKDGEKRVISWYFQNLKDSNGKITGSIAIGRDITEQKKIERALKESEEKYRITFEHTGTAMTVVEEDTTLSLVNGKFEELSGYKKEEIEGKMSWTQFVHPDDLKRMKKYHYGRRRGRKIPNSYEFRFVDRFGRVKNVLINISVIPGTKKSVASLIDITELRKITKLLRAVSEINEVISKNSSQERLLATVSKKLSSVYDAVFTVIKTKNGVRPVKMSGIDPKSIAQAVKVCPAINKALRGHTSKIIAGSKLCRKCISKPHSYVISIPITSSKRLWGSLTIHSSTGFSKDEINLLKKLSKNIGFALNAYKVEEDRKRALEQLAENLTQFDISADRLRNPLAIIMGSLELVQDLGKDEVLRIVGEQAERIRKELDEIRKEEIKTYRLVERGEKKDFL